MLLEIVWRLLPRCRGTVQLHIIDEDVTPHAIALAGIVRIIAYRSANRTGEHHCLAIMAVRTSE
jgi:hypothetical protein